MSYHLVSSVFPSVSLCAISHAEITQLILTCPMFVIGVRLHLNVPDDHKIYATLFTEFFFKLISETCAFR